MALEVSIRNMMVSDIPALVAEESAQGWQDTTEKHTKRLADRDNGRCVTLCAVQGGRPVGYVSIYHPGCLKTPEKRDMPEIVDFAVLERARGQGIGNALMDAAERVAAGWSDKVYLGVGLHSGYGSAQRMYTRRGYQLDGTGVWYEDAPLEPYAPCRNDDALVLYLVKQLET